MEKFVEKSEQRVKIVVIARFQEKQRGMCRAFERQRMMRIVSLFLSALLDALTTSVEGALATGLLGHLLASLLVCGKKSEMTSQVCMYKQRCTNQQPAFA